MGLSINERCLTTCPLAMSKVECYSIVSFTVVDCGTAPDVVNGMTDLVPLRLGVTTFGQTAMYSCNNGYTAQGVRQNRICLANGQWSESDLVCKGESYG